MESSNKKSANQPPHDSAQFMFVGAILGAGIGAGIGFFAGQWIFWAAVVGGVGLTVGAVIDRNRR